MSTKGLLNYTGNKSKLIGNLNEVFEKSTATRLVDCCCGGLSVSLHSKFDTVIANDLNDRIIELYRYFATMTYDSIKEEINKYIKLFDLDKENKDGYLRLRKRLNNSIYHLRDNRHVLLYLAHCYSFSNMIRFNGSGMFNAPFGEREFNPSIDANLQQFYNIIETKNITYTNDSFVSINIEVGDLVYIDPPYLITEAVYNKGWTQTTDCIMMDWLDELHERGIDFVMSNVTHHRGKINQKLIDWAETKKYTVINKDHKYVSNSYQAKDMDKKTIEVIITNVKV